MIFRKLLGIDFGTSRSRVVLPDKGLLLEMPTLIVLEKSAKKIIAIGDQAAEMIGKEPNEVKMIRPVKNSTIADYRATTSFLRYLINQSLGKFSLSKPVVVISVPSSVTSVEKRALEEAAVDAGASEVFLFPSSYLAAIGSGLEIQRPMGNMVVDVGAGTTETAVLSFNGIVVSNSIKVASGSINEALINHFKKAYGLIIGETMAEKIKLQLCTALPLENQKSLEVRGRDAGSGMPRSLIVQSNDLVDAIKSVLNQIILSIKSVLERTPPELSSDIVDNGIMVTGGGVLLENFKKLMEKAFGIPVLSPEFPELATAYGLQKVVENFDNFAYKVR